MGRLQLHIPTLQQLWYRRRMLEDPQTMNYNRGYDLVCEGYDRGTGCIAFPETKWQEWYARWIGQAPQRFYAYIVRSQDGAFLGEVCAYHNSDHDWYDMGVVLEGCHRGQGYAQEALALLLHHVFHQLHAAAVHNHFEGERAAAMHIHLNAGFTVYRKHENGLIELLLKREQYLSFPEV